MIASVLALFSYGLPLDVLLSPTLPLLQQLENGLLHLLGRIALGEEFAQLIPREREFFLLRLLFLGHDGGHHVEGELPFLAEFLEPLGLGEGRRGLLALHGIEELRLLVVREIGQLHGGVERNFLIVHHVQ